MHHRHLLLHLLHHPLHQINYFQHGFDFHYNYYSLHQLHVLNDYDYEDDYGDGDGGNSDLLWMMIIVMIYFQVVEDL